MSGTKVMNDVKELNISELLDKRKRWIESNKENGFNLEHILVGLYSDASHFIYEILQNAEDAGATSAFFELYEDRLEIEHNGEDFSYENIDAITSIGNSTKKDDVNKIGKF